MNKAREQLAEMFLSCLQEERLPWNQPWVMDVPGFGAHHNPITGTRYRGMNATILWAMGLEHQYPDPRWCTFKQAQNKDWHIKKGEKGTPIEFWCIYDTRERKKLTLHEADEIVRQNPDREEDFLLGCPMEIRLSVWSSSAGRSAAILTMAGHWR